jgi:ABC-type branched-subunit amino acid transport system substrate-binding protein
MSSRSIGRGTRLRIALSSVIVGTVALTAACGGSSDGGSASGGGDASQIGIVVAETGPLAGVGKSFLQGATVAANQVNDQDLIGSGGKIELVKKEGSEDPAKTASVVAQLAADPDIIGVACCILSPVAGAAKPIAQKQKLPLVIWGATELGMAEPPYVIRTTTMPHPANEVVATTVAEKKGVKSAVYVVMTDNAGIVSQGDSFKKGLGGAGVEDLGQVGVLSKQNDFTSAAAQVIQKNPDAVVVAATQAEAVGMIAALHDKGYQGQVIAGETIVGTGVFQSQPDALAGVPFPVYYLASEGNELGKQFAADYKDAYGADPDDFAAQGYNAIYTMAMALKDAGESPTRESLTKALDGLTTLDDTIYGTVTFEDGQLNAESSVQIVSYTKPDGAIAPWSGD